MTKIITTQHLNSHELKGINQNDITKALHEGGAFVSMRVETFKGKCEFHQIIYGSGIGLAGISDAIKKAMILAVERHMIFEIIDDQDD